jgi:hypothetical protein
VLLGLTVNIPSNNEVFTSSQPRVGGTITSSSLDQRLNRRIEFYIDGQDAGFTLTAANGAWAYTLPSRPAGTYQLEVRANNGDQVTSVTRTYSILSTQGLHAWSEAITGGPSTSVAGRAVAVDGAGNVITSGTFASKVVFGTDEYLRDAPAPNALYLAKYSPSGALLWSKKVQGDDGQTNIADLKANSAGEIFALGEFSGTFDLGDGPMTSVGPRDAFLAKFSSSGALLWSRQLPATGATGVRRIALGSAGQAYISVNFSGTATPGATPFTTDANDPQNFYIARFSASGAHEWSQAFGGISVDSINDIAVDGSDNVHITGLFATTIDFGGGPIVGQGTGSAYLARFNANGVHDWSRDLGGDVYDVGVRLAADSAGNTVVGGLFSGVVNFGDGPRTAPNNERRMFLARYNDKGNLTWSRQINSSNFDNFTELLINSAGVISAIGYHYATIDLGGGPRAASGQLDSFIATYNANGGFSRQRFLTSTRTLTIRGAATDQLGSVVVAGDFNGPSANFGGGPLQNPGLRAGFLGVYR